VYSRENPEDRLLFLDTAGRPLSDECETPDLTGCGPPTFDKELAPQDKNTQAGIAESSHVSVALPFKASWLANRIDFEELGWQRARNRLRGALTYMWKLSHRVHQKGKFNKDGCCFCMTSPEAGIEQATQRALLRAASREAENNEGTRRLALSYTKNDGIWYSHSRLEKEGPLEVRDVDSLPF
jgi:hypothetical protein